MAKAAEKLRHIIQHLDESLDEVAAARCCPFGTLAWRKRDPDDPDKVLLFSFTPGAMYNGSMAKLGEGGERVFAEAQPRYELVLGAQSFDLGYATQKAEVLIRAFERMMIGVFGDTPRIGSDMLASVYVKGIRRPSP